MNRAITRERSRKARPSAPPCIARAGEEASPREPARRAYRRESRSANDATRVIEGSREHDVATGLERGWLPEHGEPLPRPAGRDKVDVPDVTAAGEVIGQSALTVEAVAGDPPLGLVAVQGPANVAVGDHAIDAERFRLARDVMRRFRPERCFAPGGRR